MMWESVRMNEWMTNACLCFHRSMAGCLQRPLGQEDPSQVQVRLDSALDI